MATVVIIGSGGGNQQNRAASASIDGQSIVGANGEVIMYCENPEAALRYLKRVCGHVAPPPKAEGEG